jgi:hypothetical protein
MAAKATSKEKGLSKRVSALEREVKGLTRETPMPAEQRVSGAAASAREADVAQHLARLGGRRVAGLTPDDLRGSTSPIGMGRDRRGKR